MATEAGGTHPTGMDSCIHYINAFRGNAFGTHALLEHSITRSVYSAFLNKR